MSDPTFLEQQVGFSAVFLLDCGSTEFESLKKVEDFSRTRSWSQVEVVKALCTLFFRAIPLATSVEGMRNVKAEYI